MNRKFTTMQWLEALSGAFDSLLVPDFYTHTHQILTATFVKSLGNKLGLDVNSSNILWMAARLHDIGKMGILLELHQVRTIKLERNSPQFAVIKTHTLLGEYFFKCLAEHLSDSKALLQLAAIARWHHERWDGAGYPDGLSGYMIPLCARLVAVVDSLAAMQDPGRPYRAPLSFADAMDELRRCSGSQFDPHVVDAVLDIFQQHPDFLSKNA